MIWDIYVEYVSYNKMLGNYVGIQRYHADTLMVSAFTQMVPVVARKTSKVMSLRAS